MTKVNLDDLEFDPTNDFVMWLCVSGEICSELLCLMFYVTCVANALFSSYITF